METSYQQLIKDRARSIYALIALGYTMVYGVLRLINFRAWRCFQVGAYIGFYSATKISISLNHRFRRTFIMVVAMIGAAM